MNGLNGTTSVPKSVPCSVVNRVRTVWLVPVIKLLPCFEWSPIKNTLIKKQSPYLQQTESKNLGTLGSFSFHPLQKMLLLCLMWVMVEKAYLIALINPKIWVFTLNSKIELVNLYGKYEQPKLSGVISTAKKRAGPLNRIQRIE